MYVPPILSRICNLCTCRVQNYRVRSGCTVLHCHRKFSQDSKSCCWSGHSELQATRRMPLWTLAIDRTNDGQEHKIIWRAGLEQDTIFYLRVTACREQGSHCQDERLAWVASRGQWTSYSNSFVSKVLGANYNRANNFHPVADKLITDMH